MDVPIEYAAQDEWMRISRGKQVPGNIPASAMRAMMAKVMDPHIREEMAKQGRSDIVMRWASVGKTEKVEYIVNMTSKDEITELLSIEPDDDICECLISRRRELRG